MSNKQHDLKWPIFTTTWGKKSGTVHSHYETIHWNFFLITFSEYFDSFQSDAICLLRCLIFHFKRSFTQKYFHFSLWFVLAAGKASSYDVVHILNVSLGTSNTQCAINFFKEHIAEEKILIKLLFISFWILNNAFSALWFSCSVVLQIHFC